MHTTDSTALTTRPARGTSPEPPPYIVAWDEVPPELTPGWPPGGAVFFIWPTSRGERRWPEWLRRPFDPEDEDAYWWTREDCFVAAAWLRPYYASLMGSLAAKAGPAWVGVSTDGFDVAGLVEGANDAIPSELTLRFGSPCRAILHARRDERCIWLWVADELRSRFEDFRESNGGDARYRRWSMDWAGDRTGVPAPRPPATVDR